jgi:hypothetical protein
MLAQVGIEVAWVAGDFAANPSGDLNRLIFARKFDLRQDKPTIVAVKLVHLPALTTEFNDLARLFDQRAKTKVHQLLSIG